MFVVDTKRHRTDDPIRVRFNTFPAKILPSLLPRYLLKEEPTSMARTYRDIAVEQMLGTVEEAMCQVIDWWETCRRL